ncbi:hypothetical protein COP2_024500 [Malus domestica]
MHQRIQKKVSFTSLLLRPCGIPDHKPLRQFLSFRTEQMRRRTQADIRVYSKVERPTFWFILVWRSIDLIAFLLQLVFS